VPPKKNIAFVIMGILFAGFVTHSADANPLAEDPPIPPPRPTKFFERSQDNVEDKVNEQAGAAREAAVGRKIYRALLIREAEKNGLPPDIADSVAAIESGYDPTVVGAAGEIGLMQVLPDTAAMLGFKGDLAELAKPEVNIHYGVTYLAEAWRLANGDLCRALMKYRAGHGEEVMSPLSLTYCGRARAHLASIGSALADGVSAPIVAVEPSPRRSRGARRGPPPIRTAAVSRAFWAVHDARVKAITARIEAKWRKIASR